MSEQLLIQKQSSYLTLCHIIYTTCTQPFPRLLQKATTSCNLRHAQPVKHIIWPNGQLVYRQVSCTGQWHPVTDQSSQHVYWTERPAREVDDCFVNKMKIFAFQFIMSVKFILFKLWWFISGYRKGYISMLVAELICIIGNPWIAFVAFVILEFVGTTSKPWTIFVQMCVIAHRQTYN